MKMSGTIGLHPKEPGSRGVWWEKRWALLRLLQSRGHSVDWVGRLSKHSREQWRESKLAAHHELLILEFGSSNASFYGKDLERTRKMVQQHRGRVLFICDDPDLPLNWDAHQGEDWGRWTVWHNSPLLPRFGKQPEAIRVLDYPFAAHMLMRQPKPPVVDRVLYIGRLKGREKTIESILTANRVKLTVAGERGEWPDTEAIEFIPSCPQPRRASLYARYVAGLALCDAKHARLSWRTGRAHHALHAGVPILVGHENPMLSRFACVQGTDEPEELEAPCASWTCPETRTAAWERQVAAMAGDKHIAEQTLEATGL